MGLFDVFKKKECCICGNEVGLLGNRKLEDGNMCAKCTKKLSSWFEDRRSSTVQQIKEQLAYRAQNEENLKSFEVSRVIGDFEKIHIEEVNGIPTRFFVTQFGESIEDNPDIISFRDVVSCVMDLDVHDEELKQKDSEGNRVSYNPPRYHHHYNFIIRMEIRNNPYFDDIHFTVNSNVVTLETVGGVSGFGGAVMSGLRKGAGINMQTESYANARERRRYSEYEMMCSKIIQAVEDGKRGAQPAAQAVNGDPIQIMMEQMRNATDRETLTRLQMTLTMMIMNHPDKEMYSEQIVDAMTQAQIRMDCAAAGITSPEATAPAQEAPRAKFCSNCGAPADGGKFCQHCGSKL